MKKILCIGSASYDVTIPLKGFPIENTKNRISELVKCGGGPASNAAFLLGKWGADVHFAGLIGNDNEGKAIREEFKSVNVNVDLLKTETDFHTTVAYIINNTENGSRTIYAHRNEEFAYPKQKIEFKPDIIVTDAQEVEFTLAMIKKYPDAVSILDAGTLKEKSLRVAHEVDFLVCSKVFAEDFAKIKFDFTNPRTLVNIFSKLENEFENNVVITLEDMGSLCKINDMLKIVPSIKVDALDTTGAGDIYHGAFAYGLSKGYDLEKIVTLSNIAGALSVTKIGGRFSMPTLKEAIDEAKRILP